MAAAARILSDMFAPIPPDLGRAIFALSEGRPIPEHTLVAEQARRFRSDMVAAGIALERAFLGEAASIPAAMIRSQVKQLRELEEAIERQYRPLLWAAADVRERLNVAPAEERAQIIPIIDALMEGANSAIESVVSARRWLEYLAGERQLISPDQGGSIAQRAAEAYANLFRHFGAETKIERQQHGAGEAWWVIVYLRDMTLQHALEEEPHFHTLLQHAAPELVGQAIIRYESHPDAA